MSTFNNTFLLRLAVAIILLAQRVPGMFSNGIHNFGNNLKQIGFNPFGILLASTIKGSHMVSAFCLVFEKFVMWAWLVTIFILIAGIVMVHFKEGWFVVALDEMG